MLLLCHSLVEAKPLAPPSELSHNVFERLEFRTRQVARRAGVVAARIALVPAHFRPFSRIAAKIAHGEPFAGLTVRTAARNARRMAEQDGTRVVVGRLAPNLSDPWSVRGAERSFRKLIRLAAPQPEGLQSMPAGPSMISIAFDPASFGLTQVEGSPVDGEQVSSDAMVRLAHFAKQKGVGVEVDIVDFETMAPTLRAAERIVREVRLPVRLALAARYRAPTGTVATPQNDSEIALHAWSELARRTGLRLGVRLVKGSTVEADQPNAVNFRGPILDSFKQIITQALKHSDVLDVAVASQNAGIWEHTQSEAARLQRSGRKVDYAMHVIRGVAPALQARMRAAGKLGGQYVSYGPDAPAFGIAELFSNWKNRRKVAKQAHGQAVD